MKSVTFPNTWFNPTMDELNEAGLCVPVAFDMDGVLSETGTILYEAVCKRFNVDDCRVYENGYETFNFKVDGISGSKMFSAINEIIGEEAGAALPSPYMADVMAYVYETTGEPITIVTARAQENMTITYEWLAQNLQPVSKIVQP